MTTHTDNSRALWKPCDVELSLALQAEQAADAATDALASEDSDEHCIATLAALYRAQVKLMQAVLDAGETRLDARSLSNLRTIFGAQIERVTQYGSNDAALVDSRPCVYLSIDLARELAASWTAADATRAHVSDR